MRLESRKNQENIKNPTGASLPNKKSCGSFPSETKNPAGASLPKNKSAFFLKTKTKNETRTRTEERQTKRWTFLRMMLQLILLWFFSPILFFRREAPAGFNFSEGKLPQDFLFRKGSSRRIFYILLVCAAPQTQ